MPEAYNDDLDTDWPAPTKVHLRGVDALTTADIKQYANIRYNLDDFEVVEWINDTSVNLVYRTPEAAFEALSHFSAISHPDLKPSELRAAKPTSTHPDVQLFARQAFKSDRKERGAREKSRFYLMNREHDPAERRYDGRYHRAGGGGRGRGGRDRRQKPEQPFHEDMYDDTPTANNGNASRRQSQSSYDSGAGRRKSIQYEEPDLFEGNHIESTATHGSAPRSKRDDLFAMPRSGTLRDRSASPTRDGDGRYGFADDQPARRTARQRSATPPHQRRRPMAPARDNSSKELFPGTRTSSTNGSKPATELFPDRMGKSDTPLTSGGAPVELFPSHQAKRGRELFPNKTNHSNHRRTDALHADESAQLSAPREYITRLIKRHSADCDIAARDLFSRIDVGHQTGRLSEGRPTNPAEHGAKSGSFNIRGVAREEAPGFSIRGAARDAGSQKVKELFPDKAGNNRKELFANRMQRGGVERKRAEDLF